MGKRIKGEIINRSVSASDVVDDDQDLVITRTYIDVSDNTNSTNPDAIIDPYSLGSIYKIRYDVMDSEGNSAEPARWLIVKDTTAPVISLPTGSTDLTFASTSQSNPDSSGFDLSKEFMLTGLYVYDNYENSIRAEPLPTMMLLLVLHLGNLIPQAIFGIFQLKNIMMLI